MNMPVELQMEIFDLAASSRPVTIPKFMLVSWWVNKLVEPLLYRTIVVEQPIDGYPVFTKQNLLRAIQSKPASFFRYSVRHLNLTSDFRNKRTRLSTKDAKIILSACCGVVDLVITGEFLLPDAPTLNSLPLRRLAVPLWTLFYRGPTDFFTPHPTHSRLHPAHFLAPHSPRGEGLHAGRIRRGQHGWSCDSPATNSSVVQRSKDLSCIPLYLDL
ncbi:hypothetical protein MSAN_00346600 [Mycena sanguinolenta]|uniref:Uncharacterized protein n=1 Tax=Mycena sanguinolenta TaxID=230812 RepID=A0A8H7DHK8_9AGAR|nr:hypothetical protein MSAN_00346600 [Mycena sanguinolenta]